MKLRKMQRNGEEEMTKLKPCPFCGYRPILKSDNRYPKPECERVTAYEVVCTNMGCIIYNADDRYFLRAKDAIEAWNRRDGEAE